MASVPQISQQAHSRGTRFVGLEQSSKLHIKNRKSMERPHKAGVTRQAQNLTEQEAFIRKHGKISQTRDERL